MSSGLRLRRHVEPTLDFCEAFLDDRQSGIHCRLIEFVLLLPLLDGFGKAEIGSDDPAFTFENLLADAILEFLKACVNFRSEIFQVLFDCGHILFDRGQILFDCTQILFDCGQIPA